MTANTEFRSALKLANELQITVVGRKTGKKFSTPVWFVTGGEKVYLLPVNGDSTNWYRNVLKSPVMELQISGKKATAEARPLKDKKRVDEIVDMFRVRYGAADVKKYYPRPNVVVELSI
jgi:deazaflavin-dependent oxidoreductase (nitroreductase family)